MTIDKAPLHPHKNQQQPTIPYKITHLSKSFTEVTRSARLKKKISWVHGLIFSPFL